ncbi:ras guanine nucleotide exchange factor domain-containing protein [Spinellus fusiger]|nr:ras guanine nucleotide exchange factor domain-containing protein [Spinellus fusiger]
MSLPQLDTSHLSDVLLNRRKSLDIIFQKPCPLSSWDRSHDAMLTPPISPNAIENDFSIVIRRRHSSCTDTNTHDCLGIVAIEDWIAMQSSYSSTESQSCLYSGPINTHDNKCIKGNNGMSNKGSHHRRSLVPLPSLPPPVLPIGSKKLLTKMFARRKSFTLPHPSSLPGLTSCSKSSAGVSPCIEMDEEYRSHFDCSYPQTKGIISAIMEVAHLKEDEHLQGHTLGWVGVREKKVANLLSKGYPSSSLLPLLPVESDPHVYDLLEKDIPRFIHYSKCNATHQSMISSATVEKLVEKLTRTMDSDFLMDFFLTFRQFVTPIKLCKLLILRFRWALMKQTDERRLVRIRTFVVFRHWLTHYWTYDFMTSRTLRFTLCTFLSRLQSHPIVMTSPRDERIIKNLRNLLKRQRKRFPMESENSSRYLSTDTVGLSPLSFQSNSTPNHLIIASTNHWHNSDSLHPLDTKHESQSLLSKHATPKKESVNTIVSLPGSLIDPKLSLSTPNLPFLHRSRRLSSSSQRSVNEGTAWTAKVNFSIKTIKRSVPTMCHSLLHGIGPTLSHFTHHQCMCGKDLKESDLSTLSHTKVNTKTTSPSLSLSTPIPSARRLNPTHPHYPYPTLTNTCVVHSPSSCSTHGFFPLPSDIKCLENIPRPLTFPCYKPFVLRHRSEVVTQQFCIIEQQMLQNVTWDELVELRWRKHPRVPILSSEKDRLAELSEELYPCGGREGGVEPLIGFFNKICQWVASEIVKARSLEIRVQTIEKYIRIALKCYHQRNYSTLMQILLGLQSPAVSRLEKTWSRVDHYERHIFSELKEMTKPFRNWKNVRDVMTRATEDVSESSAVESILTKSQVDPSHALSGRGCIPFLGLYLSDLVFNSELPTFIEPKAQEENCALLIEDKELNARLSTHFVNFNKFRITASVVKHVLAFQVLSRAYSHTIHPDVFTELQQIHFLDNADIRKASCECEE